jgi:predicted nuclease of predicted toxin-antitoxin system
MVNPAWVFYIDENLPYSLAQQLSQLGCRAHHSDDLGMRGAKDPAVFAYAQANHMTLITGDRDFSESVST